MFEKNHNRKRHERPNKKRLSPTYSFRCDPELAPYLNALSSIQARSKFINDALRTYVYLTQYKKKFFLYLFEEGFYPLIKHMVRQYGRFTTTNNKKL